MPYQEQVALSLAIFFFAVGLAASFLPVLPGSVIAWVGIVIHKLWLWEESVSWTFFAVATVLVVLAQVVDLVFTYWGARRFGATWRGGVGAVFGGISGMIFFSLPGLILGPIVGAVAGELLGGRRLKAAGKAGVGTIVGGIVAFFFKLLVTLIVIGGFFLYLLSTG